MLAARVPDSQKCVGNPLFRHISDSSTRLLAGVHRFAMFSANLVKNQTKREILHPLGQMFGRQPKKMPGTCTTLTLF